LFFNGIIIYITCLKIPTLYILDNKYKNSNQAMLHAWVCLIKEQPINLVMFIYQCMTKLTCQRLLWQLEKKKEKETFQDD